MKKFLITTIIILLFIIITNINNDKDKNKYNITNNINYISNNITKSNNYENEKIQIISNNYKHNGLIEIIIKNKTNNILNQVVIKATCYDKDGNNLGTYSNGQYNVNNTDNYKIEITCNYDTARYNIEIQTK